MSVVDFDEHKVTTMTIIMPLQGEVNLDKVFPLLEITRIELKQNRRQTKKYKIPFCGIPGAILSARFKGTIRGIIKSTQTRCFLNAITIDISTEEKNVNIKLSKSKIQMCGATSVGLARKAASYIIDKLYTIQDEIDYINANSVEADRVCDWLKSVSKGEPIVSSDDEVEEESEGESESEIDESEACQITKDKYHYLVTIKKIEEIPDGIDKRIAQFLIKLSSDFLRYEDYCCQLNWIRTLNKVIEKPLEVIDIIKVMVNFNYDLGFYLSRLALAEKINGVNGFTARYENTIDHSVTIELPYDVPEGMKITRRKDRVPCHTFLVYRSGLVTQSGPNEELMRPAYNLFNSTINSIRNEISRPGVRKLRYKPSPKVKPIIS